MINDIKLKKDEGVILDFCEDIFMRHAEVRLNLARIESTNVISKKYLESSHFIY